MSKDLTVHQGDIGYLARLFAERVKAAPPKVPVTAPPAPVRDPLATLAGIVVGLSSAQVMALIGNIAVHKGGRRCLRLLDEYATDYLYRTDDEDR